MLKKIRILISLLCIALVFVGCSTQLTMSYTYSVATGDKIKVSLSTKDGYELSPDERFKVSKNDRMISQGIFIYADAYSQYVDEVQQNEAAMLLDSGSEDGNEYIFWCFDYREWNYAIKIADSNTALLLTCSVSAEAAEDCFERLRFSVSK